MPIKPVNLTKEELEARYSELTALYDLAEELVTTTESEFITNPEAQFLLIEPLVEQLGESTDVLTEEFINIAESSQGHVKANRNKIESALRKVYVAVEDYKKRLNVEPGSQKALANIADPIVDKIKRQAEKVITVFLEMIDFSLDRIMQKSEVEELKQRESKVATMLHQISQHHQQ